MKQRYSKKGTIIAVIVVGILLVGMLFYKGVIRLNHPNEKQYPVKGVDVSFYQGDIDWETLASQDIDFAFVKATEGSATVDEKLDYNLEHAAQSGLLVGAYHFFSYDSSGEAQAELFLNSVKKEALSLPPVVDIEFYGQHKFNKPDPKTVLPELEALVHKLEEAYGTKPIIYATGSSYDRYIAGNFPDNPIWIRNVYWKPSLKDDREWAFWQYSDSAKLEGYEGVESRIDLNVFQGTLEELQKLNPNP